MISLIKKLLISSALIVSSFSSMAAGMASQVRENSNKAKMLTVMDLPLKDHNTLSSLNSLNSLDDTSKLEIKSSPFFSPHSKRATGDPIGSEFVINQNTAETQPSSCAGLANGKAFVVWSFGDLSDVQSRIIDIIEGPPLTSSANKLIPSWVIPVKVVIDGFKDLWKIGANKNENWKNLGVNLDEIEDASWRKSLVLKEIGEKPMILETSHSTQTSQIVGNYVKSWFSSESWSSYFNSREKSVLDYSQRVIKETPSYHSFYLGNQTFNGNNFFVRNISCNPTIGAGFLPHSVVSGVIEQ